MIDPAFDRSRRWVHLPVEVKVRGFQSRILLGCAAAERGFGAVVGAKHRVAGHANELPRGIYVEKSLQRPALDGIRTRTSLGHVETCLDEEGVVYIDDEDYTAGRLSHATLERMDRFFAWGRDQADVVERFHPEISSRVRITGNPRVDLWRPDLREVFRRPAQEITERFGDFVLVTTAFAMVNNERGESYFLDVLGDNGRLATDEGRRRAEGYVEYSRMLFELLREVVLCLARARSELTVVVRPHPSERLAPWEELAAVAPNVSVVRDGALTPWLLAARTVVHNNSTSGLEAVLIGRPTVAYAPIADGRYDQNLPNRVSAIAPDVDALLAFVDDAFRDGTVDRQLDTEDVAGGHIAALTGRWACDRLVDAFLELDPPPLRLSGSSWRAMRGAVTTAPGRVVRRIERARSGRSDAGGIGGGLKFAGSSLAEVRRFLDALQRASGRFGNVVCCEWAPDVYAFVDPLADPA